MSNETKGEHLIETLGHAAPVVHGLKVTGVTRSSMPQTYFALPAKPQARAK